MFPWRQILASKTAGLGLFAIPPLFSRCETATTDCSGTDDAFAVLRAVIESKEGRDAC
jgi:hypothetical protein